MKKILQFIKLWLWDKPTAKTPKEPPPKIKAVELAHAYMVIQYHGQRVNMLKTEYVAWKAMSRKDKRIMAGKFAKYEKEGLVRFEEVDGHLICIKNKDYGTDKYRD